jgi:hypothetical protein
MSTTILAASESASHAAPISPYAVGGIALVILLALLIGLMMFGAGREHS